MAPSDAARDSSARIQIIVAVIGLLGVIATAMISNWNTIFPKPPAPTQPVAASTSPTPPEKKTERGVFSSGQLTVRGTWRCDLDVGAVDKKAGDFWWQVDSEVKRFLAPESGAVFFVMGVRDFDSLKFAELEHLQYSTQRISANDEPSNNLPKNTVVAYKTKQGRLGKVLIVGYGDDLTIRWITYQK